MKQLEKKYYIMAAGSLVGVGLVAYLWLNKDQIFIKNYNSNNINGIVNDCKCNTPTNDGVINCTCKIPVTIDPNKRPKNTYPSSAPEPAIDTFKSQSSYSGSKYTANNKLNNQYNATTTNSLFNINNKNELSGLPIYFMMIIYDFFYVYELSKTDSTNVSDVQRSNFNKYFNTLDRQVVEFNSKQLANIMSIYTKVDSKKKLNHETLKNIREYIISQLTPIISFMNVHIYTINQIKLAYNNNSKSEFKNVEDIQTNVDTLISTYVTKMSDKKEGFISYENSSPSYSYYNFQSMPIIESYEKSTDILLPYDKFQVLPSLEVSSEYNKSTVFYKDYTLIEIINLIILFTYDLKTIEEKTVNIVEHVNIIPTNDNSITDNMVKIAYRDVLNEFIRMTSEIMNVLFLEIIQIIYKNYKVGSLLEVNDLDEKNKLIISAINNFFENINEVIDLINILKEFWKESSTNTERGISNDETFNFLKGGDGLLMKMKKYEKQP